MIWFMVGMSWSVLLEIHIPNTGFTQGGLKKKLFQTEAKETWTKVWHFVVKQITRSFDWLRHEEVQLFHSLKMKMDVS